MIDIPKNQVYAAYDLVGKTLGGKWKVTKQLTKSGTGGNFSVCYLVEYDGKEYFLKALDFSSISHSVGLVDGMSAKLNEFRYERDLSNYCKDKQVNKVVIIVGFGEEVFPNYIIGSVAYLVFEKADCDVRKFMDISQTTDVAWCFKSLKDIAIGLRNLHNVGVSHQDLKPSNILVFNEESKISDLGRSMCENLKGPYNDWKFSGDQTYAPWEVFYRYTLTDDWHLQNYMTDCFLLGNLIAFYLTGSTVTALMGNFLPLNLHPAYYRGSFKAIESNLLDAFQNILDVLESSLPSVVDKQRVKRMIESLCYPIPEKRGHPKAVNSREPNYDLQRYITELNYLQTKTEFELYRLTLK